MSFCAGARNASAHTLIIAWIRSTAPCALCPAHYIFDVPSAQHFVLV